MKKRVLSIICSALFAISLNKAAGQCTVSNLAIQNVNFNTGTCTVTFSLSFDQEVNSGNKFAYIHLWTSANYHTPAPNWVGMYANPSAQPMLADLVNTLGTIAIQFNGTATPAIYNVYGPDASVTPITAGLGISKILLPGGVTERETITGFSFTLPSPCTGVQALKGDIWASQAANGKNVHCATQGLTFNINNPQIVSAFKVCNNPAPPAGRRLNIGIKNNGLANVSVQFIVYKDNGDNTFSSVVDAPGLYTSPVTVVIPGGTFSSSLSSADIAILGNSGENFNYWVEAVTVPSSGFSTVAYIKNDVAGCIPLPVVFKSFSAVRNHSSVLLKWETASEINNSGFAVERNINGSWQQIAWVPTQAQGGNSSTDLAYTYNDQNTAKGVSQYRIRQVDMDDKSKFSETRIVRGEGQLGKTLVYPNPSNDGKVNIVFEDASSSRDVSVADMSGRVVKQFRGITNNNISIENLNPGMYTVRITVPETGEQVVQKVVVNKR